MLVLEQVPLADHTTLRLGGAARFFTTVTSLDELRAALAYAREHELPVHILGGGSNTLFSDEGWPGLVVHVRLLGRTYEENTKGDVRLVVGAGEVWDEVVAETVAAGMWGLENLSGIPGSVGAAPVQNIGAYGTEIAEVIDWVEVLDRATDELHVLPVSACVFGYRDSLFKRAEGRDLIVLRVALRLTTFAQPRLTYRDLCEHFGDEAPASAAAVRDAVLTIRARKFPDLATVGTAGSFFKNPIVTKSHAADIASWLPGVPTFAVDETHVKIPLAWILEQLSWKGVRRGHMGCWEAQPLVVVHYGGGTAAELLLFALAIVDDVRKRTMIELEPEVCVVRGDHVHATEHTQASPSHPDEE